MELLGLARQRSFRLSQSFCAVDPDTMKLFFFQRTLDRDRSFGKNGLDQGYFLDTHLVSAVYQLAWTTSIQTVKRQQVLRREFTKWHYSLLSPAKNTDLGSSEGPLLEFEMEAWKRERCWIAGDTYPSRWLISNFWRITVLYWNLHILCHILLRINISPNYRPKCT